MLAFAVEIRCSTGKKYVTNILKYSAISEVLLKNIWTFFYAYKFYAYEREKVFCPESGMCR